MASSSSSSSRANAHEKKEEISRPVRSVALLSRASLEQLPVPLDPDEEEGAASSSLLRQHHAAVMQRLDLQDDLLHQVLSSCSHTAPKLLLNYSDDSFARSEGNNGQAAAASSFPKVVGSSQATLLSSYTHEDLQQKDDALQAHSEHSRKLFKNRTPNAKRMRDDSCAQKLVKLQSFEAFFALVVITNAIFIGFDVERSVTVGGDRTLEMKVAQYVYTGLFTMELALRICAHGRKFFISEDWMWAWLDVFIVASSLWEVMVDIVTDILNGQGNLESVAGLSNVKSFRVIRLTRLLKTAQFIRIFRFVMALRMLVTSIISTLKALLWALVLLMLIVYVFAVLFTQAVHEWKEDPGDIVLAPREEENIKRYFESLGDTMLALFMSIAGGVSWEEVIFPLKEISLVWAFAFALYIAFTYFAVLNVVTGVFCQSAIESHQNDHAMVVQALMDNKQTHIAKLRGLFHQMNGEDSDRGVITLGMFEEKIKSPAVREYFEALGLDIWDAWSFFKLLDHGGDGSVDLEDFFDGCLRFRGPARAMDMGRIMQDQRWLIRSQGRFQNYVGNELSALQQDIFVLQQGLRDLLRAARGEGPEDWAPSNWKA